MPVSWQTRFFSESATCTLRRIVDKTRCPGAEVSRSDASASASRRSCGMSFSAHTYRCAAASSTACCRSLASCGGCSTSCPPSEYDTFQEAVAHHAIPSMCAPRDLAARIDAVQRGLRIVADHETAVLVMQHRVGEDLLREGIDSGCAVAPQHVRKRDLRVLARDARRVEVDGGTTVGRLDAFALRDLVHDRLADDVARAEGVGELFAVAVQQDSTVRARRLGNRVALHVLGPSATVRVVLQCVEVARFGAGVE